MKDSESIDLTMIRTFTSVSFIKENNFYLLIGIPEQWKCFNCVRIGQIIMEQGK